MSYGFQFIDLIFFAMVAVFLVLRLRSVLGRRPEEGERRPGPSGNSSLLSGGDNDNVVDLPRQGYGVSLELDDELPQKLDAPTPLQLTLAAIQRADRSFTADSFLSGAKAAFEMILTAFASGDKNVLRPLLSEDVFLNFAGTIDNRAAVGETLEAEPVGPPVAEIVDASVEGRVVTVTVRFVSEQVNVLRSKDGVVIEGDPNRIAKVVDVWTFLRDTGDRDPNWALIETRSVD